MGSRNTDSHYHPLSIGAHWLTLILMIAIYALIELRELFPKGSDPREAMKTWHATLGLMVLGIVFVRLAVRYLFRAPPIAPTPPAWQQLLGHVMHATLYALMIAMPLLGWLMLSAKGKPIPLFGLDLPALISPDEVLGKNIEKAHALIGKIGYFLIGLHALAGIYHHHFMHDNTLRRMSPWTSYSN